MKATRKLTVVRERTARVDAARSRSGSLDDVVETMQEWESGKIDEDEAMHRLSSIRYKRRGILVRPIGSLKVS